jgi:uncharacterized membrane protein
MTKRVKLVFLASLVLNLLLLGIIVGHLPRGSDARPTRPQRMEEALKKLPEPAQSRLREKFSEIRAAAEPLRQQGDDARAEAIRLLGADPFDENAYNRQMRKIEALRGETFRRMEQVIKQTAQELAPEERRMMAEVLRRPARPPS